MLNFQFPPTILLMLKRWEVRTTTGDMMFTQQPLLTPAIANWIMKKLLIDYCEVLHIHSACLK